MNRHTLDVLEFHALVDSICEYAQSKPGIEILQRLAPQNDLQRIRQKRGIYADLMEVRLNTALDFPSLQLEDLDEILLRASPEDSIVDGPDLLAVMNFLQTVRGVVLFLQHERLQKYQVLQEMGRGLDACESLCRNLERCLDRDGTLFDHASEELANLRRHAAATEHRIERSLEGLFADTHWNDTFQDRFVTRRNGRYVVPVRKDAKTGLPGVVHDLSNSGQTLFVEPNETLGLGNDLSQTRVEEREEIRRILARLTADLRRCLGAIRADHRILSELDACCAVARWAQVNGCELPFFSGEMKLVHARHPLLQIQFAREKNAAPRRVVPLDFQLSPHVKTLAITGSNTGGKTVALKTIGLLCLAAQAGLPVPVSPGSSFAVFDQILADIGDEQSLEANLSTFSSHVANIGDILKQCQRGRCLALLDELGSGTDPVEGGALACAILTALSRTNTLTVATTHLSMVKNFVHSRKEMMNGAVRFDVKTMRPEYVLDIGRPGASHCLEIAHQLGLPQEVLSQAERLLSPDDRRLEEMLSRLEKELREAERHNKESARLEASWKEKRDQVAKEQDELKRERKQLLLDAHQQAEAVVANTRRDVENLVRHIREDAKEKGANSEKGGPDVGKVHQVLEERSRRLQEGIRMRTERPEAPVKRTDLVVGRRVWVEKLHAHGVIEQVDADGKNVVVSVDGIPFSFASSVLEVAKDGQHQVTSKPVVKVIRPRYTEAVSSELNLIGMRVEDALVELGEYIEKASMAHMPEVRIVHGFGTGRLREAVQKWLARSPVVSGFHIGRDGKDPGNGGCTIVTFDN